MSERNVTIVCLVILGVLLLGGGGLLYYLEFSWLAEIQANIESLKAEVAAMEKKREQLPALKEKNSKLRAEIKELEAKIPRLATGGWQDEKGVWRFEYDELANLLDGLRKSANVLVSSAKFIPMARSAPTPGTQPLPANVHKVTYEINVKGPWYNLLKYINLLETQKRTIAIEKFTVKPASGQDDRKGRVAVMRHDLQIRVVSYTYRDQAVAAARPGAPTLPKAAGAEPKQPEQSRSTQPPD